MASVALRAAPLVVFAMLACAPKGLASKAPAEETCGFDTPLQPGVPGSPGFLLPSDINPNGQSELAALMRQMVVDVKEARRAVTEGKSVAPMSEKHRHLRCAWPTDLRDRTPAFDALAKVYLQQVERLESARGDARPAFANVVSACRACHESTCPGPLAVIETLELPFQ
jgi:hypothetical protein